VRDGNSLKSNFKEDLERKHEKDMTTIRPSELPSRHGDILQLLCSQRTPCLLEKIKLIKRYRPPDSRNTPVNKYQIFPGDGFDSKPMQGKAIPF
jgi:hypothetical protein